MSHAFEELFGFVDAFSRVPMPGRTDSWLLARALDDHHIPSDDSRISRFRDTYLRHLANELNQAPSPGLRKALLPGVRDLLEALIRCEAAYLCLLTGNYEMGARLKLEHFDLWRYFACGAFGDETLERNDLLGKAIARVAECGGPVVAPADAVVIGDTPLDVAVARSAGARSIAVATGPYTSDDLRASGADVVLEDLADTRMALLAIAGVAD